MDNSIYCILKVWKGNDLQQLEGPGPHIRIHAEKMPGPPKLVLPILYVINNSINAYVTSCLTDACYGETAHIVGVAYGQQWTAIGYNDIYCSNLLIRILQFELNI